MYCQTTSVSAALVTHCATYCTSCLPDRYIFKRRRNGRVLSLGEPSHLRGRNYPASTHKKLAGRGPFEGLEGRTWSSFLVGIPQRCPMPQSQSTRHSTDKIGVLESRLAKMPLHFSD